MTSTNPYMQQRKTLPKTATPTSMMEEGRDPNKLSPTSERADTKQNGDTISSNSFEVKSDPENEGGVQQPTNKQTRGTKLAKHSSFSFGHSHAVKESRLHKPAASKGTSSAEGAESATPPSQSKMKGLGGFSKLLSPGSKHKEIPSPQSSAGSGDAPEGAEQQPGHAPTDPDPALTHRPPSRLKFPGGGSTSGRSTPSSMARSGIQRPSSRLSKMGSSSISNLSKEDDEEGESKAERRLRLQRKGSDGAVKRHAVQPLSAKSLLSGPSIQSGTASLPRHLPKGILQQQQQQQHSGAAELSSSSEYEEKKPATISEHKEHRSLLKGEGPASRKLSAGLKKPGASLLPGVRTPNMPSGPHTATSSSDDKDRAPSTESSPLLSRKLMAPKAAGAGGKTLEGRLKRPTSPSSRLKLHKVSVTSAEPAPESKVGVASSLPRRETELCSSNSSLESCEVQRILSKDQQPCPTPPPQQPPTEDTTGQSSGQSAGNVGVEQGGIKSSGAESASHDEAESLREKSEMMEDVGKASHLQFGRRISPEGMSHEEVTSPRAEEKDTATSPPQGKQPVEECKVSVEKEKSADVEMVAGEGSVGELPSKGQRSRSLSPKSPYRLVPKGMSRVKDAESGVGGALMRVNSSESTSSEGTPSLSRKPLKSSMRQKRSDSSRHSSSSSMEGVISPSHRHPKVTISPRSSQVCGEGGREGGREVGCWVLGGLLGPAVFVLGMKLCLFGRKVLLSQHFMYHHACMHTCTPTPTHTHTHIHMHTHRLCTILQRQG